MKLISISILLIFSGRFFAQEILFEYKTNMRSYESYPIIDTRDDKLALFLVESDSIRAMIFDKDFKMTDEMLIKRSEDEYDNLLGGGYSNGIYQLFFSDDSKTKFYGIALDVLKKKVAWSKVPDLLGDATFLEAIPYNNQFHIFSVYDDRGLSD